MLTSTGYAIIASVQALEEQYKYAEQGLVEARVRIAVLEKELKGAREASWRADRRFINLSVACQELDLTGEHATLVGIRNAILAGGL